MRRELLLSAAFLFGALSAVPVRVAAQDTVVQKPDRSTPVPLGPARALKIPDVVKHRTANGMRLAVIELERMGLVSVRWIFPYAGESTDPAGKNGLAGYVTDLMLQGAGNMDASQVTLALLGNGASLSLSTTADYLLVKLTAEKSEIDDAMKIAADVIRRPTFPRQELDRHNMRTLDGFRKRLKKPGYWASRRMLEYLYPGNHPYGRGTSESELSGITRGDLQAFHQGRVVPRDAIVGASGLSLEELKVLTDRHFGDWTTPASVDTRKLAAEVPALKPEETGPATAGSGWTIDLYDEPSNAQSDLTLAFRTITDDDPDYDAFRLAVAVLGSGSLGRLNQNLRKDKRWSYGSYAGFSTSEKAGVVTLEASVQKDKTGASVREMLKELLRIKTMPVSAEELQTMKQYMYGSFVRGKQGVSALSANAAGIEYDGDPADYIAKYRDRLFAVTPAAVQAAARKYMMHDGVHIVIIGDAKTAYPQLTSIGTVRVYGADGKEKKGFGTALQAARPNS